MCDFQTIKQILHADVDGILHYDEFNRYEKKGIFEVQNIPERLYPLRREWTSHNQYYGAESVLKKYAGIHKPLNAFMEHGIQDRGEIEVSDILACKLKKYITFSQFRKEEYEKLIGDGRQVCVVGPYINYANPFYSKTEFHEFKRKYGRVLTFFPLHTIDGLDASKFDPVFDYAIGEIERYRKALQIDTVFICGYWRDYFVGRLEKYNINGYVMVSAGHGMSQKFLSRLRSIIELSDYTMSDAFGTHVGYCIGLGVPHIVLQKEGKIANTSMNNLLEWALPFIHSYNQFGSQEQEKVMDYIFGICQKKTEKELRHLLE